MSKYHAKSVRNEDGYFASMGEYKRFLELKDMEESGIIQNLKRQETFILIPDQFIDGKKIERKVTYVADFTYTQDGVYIVEDYKGVKTQVYKLKKKLMLKVYGVQIKETGVQNAKKSKR